MYKALVGYTNCEDMYLMSFSCLIFVPLVLQEKQANFLPRLKEKVSTPEGVPRLFDLITVQDERMKLAFFAALRNTVVAKDIDQVDHYVFCRIFSSLSSL